MRDTRREALTEAMRRLTESNPKTAPTIELIQKMADQLEHGRNVNQQQAQPRAGLGWSD